MSLIDTQTSIEYMYAKTKVRKMILDDIQQSDEMMERIDNCIQLLMNTYLMGPHFNEKNQYLSNITQSDLCSIVTRILEVLMPLKRGTTFTALVGQSAACLNMTNELHAFKIVSSVISYLSFSRLVHIIKPNQTKTGMMEVIPVFICDPKITNFIQQSMYLPPMVCAPKEIKLNTDSAYLTKSRDSVILKSYNHHDGNVCLDSINKFNQVALSLDTKMLTTFDEQPKTVIDTPQKQKQFDQLRDESYFVFKLLIQTGNDFHLTHKVDKRGRTYSQGYHCSTQGNSFRKAIINLKKEELVDGDFA